MAIKRPMWVMAVLGLLGLLASLGPAMFAIATDWHETRQQAQRASDSVAASVAADLAVALDQGQGMLPRLRLLLKESGGRPTRAALSGIMGPTASGWVAVYRRGGSPLVASADDVPPLPPERGLSFIRQGAVLAVLAEPSPGGDHIVVTARPVMALTPHVAFLVEIEDSSGAVIYRDAGIVPGPPITAPSEMTVSRQPVHGHGLHVVVSYEIRTALVPWLQRSLRTGLVAVLTALVVVPVLLIVAKRLMRDNLASAALEAANRELSRSNADLEQFAYVASHDLKEPLRNIASYVQLLQRRYQGKLDEDADAFIGYTVEGVRRMQVIINELLAYSRIGTGPLSTSPVQTGAVVSAVLGNLKSAIAEAGAVVDVVGPLPVVMGDAGQLTSVFQNLLANALKYRRDDVRPEVKVTVAEMGAAWRFSVADNGIGIDPAYQQQIFELFKRLHTRDRFTGSGIGLAVCQRVVERHGGSIWVDSIPGQGACFHFTLPKVG